jgi:hypothetical protein
MWKNMPVSEKDRALQKVFRPLILVSLSLMAAQSGLDILTNYKLVVRGDTMSPAVGEPRSILWISLAVGAVYCLGAFRLILPRFQEFLTIYGERPRSQWGMMVLVNLVCTAPAIAFTYQAGEFLNGILDSSAPRTRTVRTTKRVTRNSNTLYHLVRDWRNPQQWVYFDANYKFTQKHPFGSPFTITTKSGRFGYEWYVAK